MNLTHEQQLYITSSIQKILKTEFGSGPKTFLKNTHDRLNFACPYCGDSTDVHKKRGNIYWKNLSFHCYNSRHPHSFDSQLQNHRIPCLLPE